MSLKVNAQELFVIDRISPASQLPADDHQTNSSLDSHSLDMEDFEVGEPLEVEIVVDDIPGAPNGTFDPEPLMELIDEPLNVEQEEKEEAPKENDVWSWHSYGPEGFVNWIKDRLDAVPKHSGKDSAGLERAISFLDKLDSEISKAMRSDLDGHLDANKVEEIRCQLDDGLARLHDRLEKVKKVKKSRRKKSDYEYDSEGFLKEAQKIAGIEGIFVSVPLLISGLARVCINGSVSAGHDIEDMFARQAKKWKLTDRERFELRQLLFDMGFPIRMDRGFMPEDDIDVSDSDNYDWQANYRG